MDKQVVLVVEDSPTDALIMKHALRTAYSVEQVRTPREAQERLRDGSYVAVITDHFLRGEGTGLDLLKWIGEQGIDVPVIVMSGQGDEQLAAETLKLGAYDYIVKSEESLSSLSVALKHVLRRHELEHRAQMLQQIVENASDGIITMNIYGCVLTANRAVTPMFGYAPDELVGQSVDKLFPGKATGRELTRMFAAGASGSGWQGELVARCKDGRELQVNMSMSVLRDRMGKLTSLIGIARDMTERRQLLDRLKRLSVTDNLTGLFNHRFFHDRLQYEFMRARRYGLPLGCIMIDADYFKSVNDTYGHLVGDEVLKALGELITESTRSVDIAARYGGEEFAVLLPNTDLEGTTGCAEHIWETIGKSEIKTQQETIKITVSIGATALTSDVDTEEELHRRADAALLAAKRRGRNNVCLWDKEVIRSTVEVPDLGGEDIEDIRHNIRRLILPARERYMETVRPVLDALYRRHPRLRRHSTNATIFAMELARLAGMKAEEEEALQYGALLHDIGHVTTPREILAKAGSLTPEETKTVQNHVSVSKTLMSELALSNLEIQYVRYHHERYDGGGYPDGIKGEAIPLGARILTIADAYDAMTSHRPYRKALSEEAAIAELRNNASTQFDPHLVQLFIDARRSREHSQAVPNQDISPLRHGEHGGVKEGKN